MHEAVGKGVLRSNARDPFERALLARIELTGFMRGAPCLYTPGEPNEAAGVRAWWFAHRLWGMDTGLIEAGACAAGAAGTAHETDAPSWAEELILDGRAQGVKIASLRASPAPRDHDPSRERGARPARVGAERGAVAVAREQHRKQRRNARARDAA